MTRSRRFFASGMLAAMLSIGFPVHSQSVPPGNPPELADLFSRPDFSQVSLSPDGRYLAAVAPKPGNPQQDVLVILDADTGKPIRVLNPGRIELLGDYSWVGENRLVGAMAMQLDGLDTPVRTGELYAINADGHRAIDLFGYRADPGTESGVGLKQHRDAAATVISTEGSDPQHILISTRAFSHDRAGTATDIEQLNVMTGSTRRLGTSPAPDAAFVADHHGVVRVAYASSDYVTLTLWTRTGNDAPWTLANDPKTSQVGLRPLGFNRENTGLYVESSRPGAPNAIELMDMVSGHRRLLYQGRFADPGRLLPSMDGKDYYAVLTADGRSGIHYFDKDSPEARLNQDLEKTFAGRLVYLSSFSADQTRAVIRVSSDRNEGDFYLLDMSDHHARYLFSAASRLNPEQMRPMQPIALQARDGLPLHGFLTLPDGKPPYPTVVLVHGGPFGVSDSWGFNPEAQMFATRGYAVLQVNFRGSSGYGAEFTARGFRQWGMAMQDDLADATRWAVKNGYADPQRLCIYGASYGGYAAIEATEHDPDLFRCAIGYAGVYDMRVQLQKSDVQASDDGVRYMHETMGDNPAVLLAHSPLAGIERIKADLLLIHGGKDKRVPFANFREFTKALDAQHKSCQTLVKPDEGHGFFVLDHRVEAYRMMLDFLDRHIGKPDNPALANQTKGHAMQGSR